MTFSLVPLSVPFLLHKNLKIVTSPLNYCSLLHLGLPLNSIQKFITQAAACVVNGTGSLAHVTPLL